MIGRLSSLLLLLLPLSHGVAATGAGNKKCIEGNKVCVTSSTKSNTATDIDLLVETTGGAKWVAVNVGKNGMSASIQDNQCYIILSDGTIQQTACLTSGLINIGNSTKKTPTVNSQDWSVKFSIPKRSVPSNNNYGLAWSKNALGTNNSGHTTKTGTDLNWFFVKANGHSSPNHRCDASVYK